MRITAILIAVFAWALSQGAVAGTREGIKYFKQAQFAEALKELQPEAANGDAAAINVLGKMYSAGLGVPADAKKAADLFKRGAALGDAASQNDYGAALALGEGVEQNVDEAVKWLILASRQGHAKARQYVDRLIRYMPRSKAAALRKEALEWEQKFKAGKKSGDGEATADPSEGSSSANPTHMMDRPDALPQMDLPLPSGNP